MCSFDWPGAERPKRLAAPWRNNSLCRNIEFLGHLTPTELGGEMRNSDVFLFPSILEGHPQVLGQASACGLPSIAMNLYRPDYVLNGESGFLVESDAELAGEA